MTGAQVKVTKVTESPCLSLARKTGFSALVFSSLGDLGVAFSPELPNAQHLKLRTSDGYILRTSDGYVLSVISTSMQQYYDLPYTAEQVQELLGGLVLEKETTASESETN